MNTLKKATLMTATGVATFLALGLATPETTPDRPSASYSNASRTTPQGSAPQTTPQNTPEKTPILSNKTEDDPTWNCFTQGNKSCGTLPRVTQELGDALAEGQDATATTRNWELCVYSEGDTTYIYCPDGYTESS